MARTVEGLEFRVFRVYGRIPFKGSFQFRVPPLVPYSITKELKGA